jgi:HEXXH motif-containing protein
MPPAPLDQELAELVGFQPSAARASRLDARLRARLAASLAHVLERAGERLAGSEAARAAFFARLARGPVQPQVFGAYADLVLAVQEDRLDAAAERLAELFGMPPPAAGVRFVALGDPARDPLAARWQRLVDVDPSEPVALRGVSAARAAPCAARLGDALALLEAADPELRAELAVLVREVALAAGSPEGDTGAFDGASSLFLWGAILVNADPARSGVACARLLAHESAHNLLFGIASCDPLVENDPHERRASPLRRGLRPLAGTFHATFVLARMHRATRRLLDSGLLDAAECAAAERALRDDATDFARGLRVVEGHARLTPLGAAVMGDARAFMEDAGASLHDGGRV